MRSLFHKISRLPLSFALILAPVLVWAPTAYAQNAQPELNAQEFQAQYRHLPAGNLLPLSSAGDAYALLERANRLAAGRGGYPKNHSEAARLYSLASQLSYPGGAPSLEGLGRYPLPPFKTSNPANKPAHPPTDPLPDLVLQATATSGTAPLNTTVSISPDWPGNVLVYHWQVNQDGITRTTSSISENFDNAGPQVITLYVIDEHGRSASTSITIDVHEPLAQPEPLATPTPLFPAQDALVFIGTTIDFQWEASTSVDSYDFHFFDGVNSRTQPFLTNLPAEELCTQTLCTLSLAMELPLGGTHAWRIRARNAQGLTEWTRNRFTVVEPITQSPGAVLLLGPDNGFVIENESTVSFGWLPSERAQSYAFLLTDSADQVLVSQSLSATACSESACTLTLPIALPPYENYQWGVSATNVIGTVASSTRAFSVIPQANRAPGLPVNIFPEPNAVLTEHSTVTFRWSHDTETATYEFHFFNRTDGEEIYTYGIDPQVACMDAVCSINQVIDLPVDTTHAWRVRARNSLGITTWTRSSFDVVLPVNEPPSTPVALSPLANSFVEAGNLVAFTWEKEPLALNYSFELMHNANLSDAASQNANLVVTQTLSQSACGDSTCSINLPLSTGEHNQFEWRVQAANDNGVSDWVSTPFVLIDAPTTVPDALTVLSPTDGEVLVQRTSVAVLWTQAANATRYDVLLEDNVNASNQQTDGLSPLDICVDNVCTHMVVLDVSPGNNQSIRVRAVNSLGTSDWTTISFQVIGDGAPDAPSILSPLNNSHFADIGQLNIRWKAVDFALSYEVALSAQEVSASVAASRCAAAICEHFINLPLTEAQTDAFEVHVRATTPSGVSDWATASFAVITDTNGLAPVAAFSLVNFTGNALGAAPLNLTFDPSDSTDDVGLVNFQWAFSDDENASINTASNTPTSRTFTEPGIHTVTLTVTDAQGLTNSATRQVTVFDPSNTLSAREASRLLTQATFGATDNSILELQALGVDAWLQQQFALQSPAHLDYVNAHSNNSQRWPRHEVWWRDVVEGDDQLRQRAAFALSQLFVISDIGYTLSNSQYGVTHFYDQLRDNAFGNYRQLLEIVTKSPVMGLYLSMLQNEKANEAASTRPDENYAREVLQLFSIGVDELNIDGTPTGAPAYTLGDVEEFARVFTGWNYKDAGVWNRGLNTGQDLISPMEPFEAFHDTGSKTLLGGEIIPAGLSAEQDLQRALDNIANHPNVGPFIAKHFIQRLTTSNPNPEYVARVATVFNDNGNGVRGDLQAVVQSVLMDAEARTTNRPAHFGKLREPVIRLSHLWRAFSISPGSANSARGEYNTNSPSLENLDLVTGQAVLKSASVFNFFKPEFAAIGPVSANNLVSPEFQVMTESTEIATTNRIGDQINRYFASSFDALGTQVSYLNFDTELALADDPDALMEHLDILLMAGTMGTTLRAEVINHITALPNTATGRSERVRDAVTLIMASPDYLIQQ